MKLNFKILIFHPGIQHAPRLVKELQSRYEQTYFITSCIFSKKNIFPKILSLLRLPLARTAHNRVFEYLDFRRIKCYFYCEIYGYISKNITKRNTLFQKKLNNDEWLNADIIIGFDTSSHALLPISKKSIFILDQTTPHYQLNVELNERFSLERESLKTTSEIKTEQTEHDLSDYIVVASSFTKQSLIKNGVNENKIQVIPYGVDLKKFPYKNRNSSKSLVYIYVGNVSRRKGIKLLLDSWQEANKTNHELWIVGPILDSFDQVNINKTIKFFGKVAHHDLINLLHQANVFVFPSYFDGFGLVLLEAMSSGLPIIASSNSAAPDLIKNGEEGFIFEAGNKAELISRIEYFSDNLEQSFIMGKMARQTAEKFTWKAYGDKWENFISNLKN